MSAARERTQAGECPAVTDRGTPCQKGNDHGGGHWFMSDDQYACLSAHHFDPLSVLTLGPLVHLDVPCPRHVTPPESTT